VLDKEVEVGSPVLKVAMDPVAWQEVWPGVGGFCVSC